MCYFYDNTNTNTQQTNLEKLAYLTIGYDADITCKWEENRRANPDMFKSQFNNKLGYVSLGVKEFTGHYIICLCLSVCLFVFLKPYFCFFAVLTALFECDHIKLKH